MRNFNNTLIIYPQDPTIDFLQPIVDLVKSYLPNSVLSRPKYGESVTDISDNTELIVFLGHGTNRELFGGVDHNEKKHILFNTQNGAHQFDGCALVIFSCNSIGFLKNIKANPVKIEDYIVFGDMPTDEEHVKHNQKVFPGYWADFELEHLEHYKRFLVDALSNGFRKAIQTDSFHGFTIGINHIVNDKTNEVIQNESFSINQKLQFIERLIEFKNEIYFENSL